MKILLVAPLYFYFALGHVGLALATAFAAYVNAYLLYRGLLKAEVYRPAPGWLRLLLRYGAANLAMVLVLFGILQLWDGWQFWSVWQRAVHLALTCLAGGATYLIGLLLVGVRVSDFRAKA